jgi:hypothetical protein
MIATASGRPSVPARMAEPGLPPTASQTGRRLLDGARVDAEPGDRGAVAPGARPRDVLAVAQREEQVELLGEELVVVLEVVAEEREGLDERAPAGHDLGAAAGQQVDGRELLEDANGVVGAQHGDGARQADALRARCSGAEHDGGRRNDEVGAVVLADAEDVEADLLGELGLLEQVAHALLRADRRGQLGKRVQAKFHDPDDSAVVARTTCTYRPISADGYTPNRGSRSRNCAMGPMTS